MSLIGRLGDQQVPAGGGGIRLLSIRIVDRVSRDDEPDELPFDRLTLDEMARGLAEPPSQALLRGLSAVSATRVDASQVSLD